MASLRATSTRVLAMLWCWATLSVSTFCGTGHSSHDLAVYASNQWYARTLHSGIANEVLGTNMTNYAGFEILLVGFRRAAIDGDSACFTAVHHTRT